MKNQSADLKTGLIIDEPYISQILLGEKSWEMRSQRTAKREVIGLIKKGSGQVVGKATIVDCIGPLSFSELQNNTVKHGISKQQLDAGLLDKWNFAWVLEKVEMFEEPMPYNHPSGAVIWVDLPKAIRQQKVKAANKLMLDKSITKTNKATVDTAAQKVKNTDTITSRTKNLPPYKLETTPKGKELFAYFAAILSETELYDGKVIDIGLYMKNISGHIKNGRIIKVPDGHKLTAVGKEYFLERHKPGNRQFVEPDTFEYMKKGLRSGGLNWVKIAETNNQEKRHLPVARDGSSFTKELSRGGCYTVGDKGDEQKFSSFEEALKYLKSMDTAKWRRPNPKGNWGIVSAIAWK